MLDLIQLLPHCKKDAKLDTKTDKGVISEVADMKVRGPAASPDLAVSQDGPSLIRYAPLNGHTMMQGCGNVVFFEARKKQDLYLWLAKTPEGPSVKFLALNGMPHAAHPLVP